MLSSFKFCINVFAIHQLFPLVGDPDWAADLKPESFDAVVTATALHWLEESVLLRVYRDVARLLRPGGMFVNADHMPLENPMFSQAGRRLYGGWFEAFADREDWEGWWEAIAKEKEMEEALAERERRFGRRSTHEFMPPASWHIQRLSGAGFSSAEIVWRSFDEAVLAAWK